MVGDLPQRIGPLLRQRAGISALHSTQEVRDRLVTYLNGLSATLPEDLSLVFSVVLALRQGNQSRFLEERMQWLADELGRDARTISRRFDEALELLIHIEHDYSKEHTGEFYDSKELDRDGGIRPLTYQATVRYRLAALPPDDESRVGFVTGDIRRVKFADIWVNPENTRMMMARFDEHSVSAVIRYGGAVRDEFGEVVDDCIASELLQRVADTRLVAPGATIVTSAGQLKASNNVRYIVHVATVSGEPGEGYRHVRDIGRCVGNVLDEAERLYVADPSVRTILIPILGVGMGGGRVQSAVPAMLDAAIDNLAASRIRRWTVLFLAYTAEELENCAAVFTASPQLAIADRRRD
jgi:O-acetyl-ADP-ribose deacetylase (regulator of RNase III)